MTLAELLAILARNGVRIEAKQGCLRLYGPPGAVPEPLRVHLQRHKTEIIAYLEHQQLAPILPTEILPSQDDHYHVSFGQARLLFLDQLRPRSAAYNVASAVHFRGHLKQSILEKAAFCLIERHESLRTYFHSNNGQFHAVIGHNLQITLPLVDLSQLEWAARAQAYAERCRSVGSIGFDLQTPPLWRWELIRLDQQNHALVVAIHHTIADGWSLAQAMQELGILYKTLESGRLEAPLKPLRSRYVDFAIWQRHWITGEVKQRLLHYWLNQVDGFLEPLTLPTDRPRPTAQSDRGDTHAFSLDLDLTQRLRQFSSNRGVSLPVLFLAAFALLLHRYSHQEHFLLGTAITNRPHPKLQQIFGFFVNWLPLRADFRDGPSFNQLLERFHRTALSAYEHQDLPFEELVRATGLPRDLSRHPLFQAMVVFHVPAKSVDLGNLDCFLAPFPTHSAKLDLTLFVTDARNALPLKNGNELFLEFEFSTDLFERLTIERMATNFVALLHALLANPDQPVETLAFISPQEWQLVVSGWNDTAVRYGCETIHGLFELQVQRSPESLALRFGVQHLSYRELDQQANRHAGELLLQGLGSGKRVGVYLERSIELVVAVLAILKAGAAYVPLEPLYPQQRLAFIVQDSELALILTSSTLEPNAAALGAPIACIDQWLENRHNLSQSALEVRGGPEMPAYLIYTSGTSGEPKGVLTQHASVTNFLQWLNQWLEIRSDDRVLLKTPISFDASGRELLAPLVAGACLVIAPPSAQTDPHELNRLLEHEAITILHSVPSLYESMLHSDTFHSGQLRHVVCGGEILCPDTVALHRQLSSAQLHNVYGPTEATVDVTAWRCDPEMTTHGAVPIGRPIANARIYILDTALNPVPIGVIGEIYIGGTPVSLGYWRRPELTAEKFIPDPFCTENHGRLYKTGDLGRYLHNGALLFEGRVDQQINLRGHRIELQEIAGILRRHPAIDQCVVTARSGKHGETTITAYVQTKVGGREEPVCANQNWREELRQFAAQWLPLFMLPSHFIAIEAMPTQPNGKIDYTSLPTPETANVLEDISGQPPVTEAEHIVASVFQEILHLDQVSRTDNFFELGGHSLLAAQAASRLKARFGVAVAVRDLFECHTVAQLASTLLTRSPLPSDDTVPLTRITRP